MGVRDRLFDLGRDAVRSAASAALDWAAGPALEPDEIIKADGNQKPTSDPTALEGGDLPTDKDLSLDDPKAMFWDPFAIIEQLGYKERPTQMTYGTLRAIVYKVPIVQAIIQTRVNQIASFAQPQLDRYQLGFQLKLRDQDAKPTPADKKWIREAQSLVMHTGVYDDPRYRDNFEMFLRKLVWDSLTYDQCCFEIVPNRKGTPAQWYAVDASTMRLADTATAYLKKKTQQDTKFVQIYDGMIVTEFMEDELCFGVRNPRTDMKLYGYGTSELEMTMTAITSLLWSWQYNSRFFSQGSAQKGILNFKGAIPDKQLKGFRRHWYTMLSGVENAWRTPITNADELQWISMQESNRDMEFSAWMDFLIKVVCSLFNMDPIEVNFQYGNVGQKSALQEASNREKITQSKERGLRPLLRFLAAMINRHIIWPMNENFEFEFVGLDAATHDDMAKRNQLRVKTTRTVDELRAEDGLEPMPDGMGEVILDPTWMQWVQQKKAEEMGVPGEQPPGAEAFGGPPGEEEEPPAEGEESGMDFQKLLAEQLGEEEEEEEEAEADAASKKRAEKKAKLMGKSGNGHGYLVDIEL